MPPILVTFSVLNWEMFTDSNDSHPANIADMLVTYSVLMYSKPSIILNEGNFLSLYKPPPNRLLKSSSGIISPLVGASITILVICTLSAKGTKAIAALMVVPSGCSDNVNIESVTVAIKPALQRAMAVLSSV